MNIALDIYGIVGKSKDRGIGNYIRGLIKNLLELDKENKYFLFNYGENVYLKDILNYGENVSEYNFSFGKDEYALRNSNSYPLLGKVIKRFIKENEIDLFCVLSPFEYSIIYDKKWFSEIKYAVIVYDLIPLIFSRFYLTNQKKREWYNACLDFVSESDMVFAISQCTKYDLIKYTPIDPEKIHVIYAGVNEKFCKYDINEYMKQEVYSKYGIDKPFILLVGGDDKRKNMEEQIEAYSKLPENLRSRFDLVIVCYIKKNRLKEYENLKAKYNIRNSLIFTNFVPEKDLMLLYNTASAFMFVTKYEGFGLPVLEAMKCGLPVLTSDNSSLVEIAKDAAILANPFQISDITRGLEEILTKADIDDLIHRGFERTNQFSWKISAKYMLDAIQYLDIDVYMNEKIKIAFFTSLPPIKSGISDYSEDILNTLADVYDIDVFIDDGYEVDCTFPTNIKIFNHNLFEKKAVTYDRYLFQMGCNKFHLYMYPYIKKYGGIIVLHDANMQAFIRPYSIVPNSADFKKYSEYLAYDYGKDIVDEIITATFNWDKSVMYKYPINGFITSYASNIIVHSDYAQSTIKKLHMDYNVTTIPHYAKNELSDLLKAKVSAHQILGIEQDNVIISIFGQLAETKRIFQILRALPDILSENKNISVYFVGFADDSMLNNITNYISKSGFSNRIFISDNAHLKRFLSYMDASDICLNLRYPYHGESSGSLARLLYKGKCTIITDIGSFSEIPDDCCVKLPYPENITEEEEIGIIREAISDLINNPDKVNNIGAKAMEYAKTNLDIKIVAQKYIDVINNAPCNIYSDEYLNYLREDFSQYIPNKKELDNFNKTILYATGK